MPDRRRHRGPAPGDEELFGPQAWPALRAATAELSWLLSRGYPPAASLKLVGDRHRLTARQRRAVSGAACDEATAVRRRRRRLALGRLADRAVHVDAFNVVILGESILSGAPVFRGRDGALRDLGSVHGTWRRVQETPRAVDAYGELLAGAAPTSVTWWVDAPVSNSGRLAAMLRKQAERRRLPWRVEVVGGVDARLREAASEARAVLATADAALLDAAGAWVDLPAALLEAHASEAWLVDLGQLASPR